MLLWLLWTFYLSAISFSFAAFGAVIFLPPITMRPNALVDFVPFFFCDHGEKLLISRRESGRDPKVFKIEQAPRSVIFGRVELAVRDHAVNASRQQCHRFLAVASGGGEQSVGE
jgi:hypothetical protein